MVNLLGGRDTIASLALFTQRMSGHVSVADIRIGEIRLTLSSKSFDWLACLVNLAEAENEILQGDWSGSHRH